MQLVEIQKLAKIDGKKASQEIHAFVQEKFALEVVEVMINPSAVSLNSVNGFLRTPKQEYFFKFHAEENEHSFDEFYRAEILEDVGYPVVKPIFASKKAGEQFLIYEKITDPTFFDVCETADTQFLKTEKYDASLRGQILLAEQNLCQVNARIFQKTRRTASDEKVAQEPIWQLFFKRIMGDQCRLETFYRKKNVLLPNGAQVPFEEFSRLKWEINGQIFDETIEEIISSAQKILNPFAQKSWTVVTAHGDDHNGNKFLRNGSLQYFDPAFAGNAIPMLLAPAKTTFHDCFAHPFWFYSPRTIEEQLNISMEIRGESIIVSHNFSLETVAPLRLEMLKKKFEIVWKPIFSTIPENEKASAKNFVKKALFCCPFVCLNFLVFPPNISLFAFARAVEMGAFAEGSLIDDFLSEI